MAVFIENRIAPIDVTKSDEIYMIVACIALLRHMNLIHFWMV